MRSLLTCGGAACGRLGVWLLVTLATTPGSLLGQAREELVYTGTPQWTIQGEPGTTIDRKLSPEDAAKFRLRIVRREGRYYWASREDQPLELVPTGLSRYVIFRGDGGFIKLVNPYWDATRAPLRATDPSERFDYMEVLHTGLALVIYWGRGEGVPLRTE